MLTKAPPAPVSKTEPPPITSVADHVSVICDEAITHARIKMAPGQREWPLAKLLVERDFVEYAKFGIARSVAREVGTHDPQVLSVHYFDPDANPDAETEADTPVDPTINLIVVVRSKSPALTAYVESLDKAVTETVREWPPSPLSVVSSLLNVILVTEEDIQQRRGYAAVLGSVFTPQRKIWEPFL